MSRLGMRLFGRQSFFDYYSATLTKRILPSIRDLLQDDPDLPHDEIEHIVCARAELHPLEIGSVEAITIELEESHFQNKRDCIPTGYLAEARVEFEGSKALWSAKPSRDFVFPLGGKCGTSHMRMLTYLDGKDFDPFEDFVLEQVRSARAAVRALDAEIVFFNVVGLPHIQQQLGDKKEWIERTRAEIIARKMR